MGSFGQMASGIATGMRKRRKEQEQEAMDKEDRAWEQESRDMQRRKMGIEMDALEADAEFKQWDRDRKQALGTFLATEDPAPVAEAFTKHTGVPMQITPAGDGNFNVTAGGSTKKMSKVEIAQYAHALGDPDAWTAAQEAMAGASLEHERKKELEGIKLSGQMDLKKYAADLALRNIQANKTGAKATGSKAIAKIRAEAAAIKDAVKNGEISEEEGKIALRNLYGAVDKNAGKGKGGASASAFEKKIAWIDAQEAAGKISAKRAQKLREKAAGAASEDLTPGQQLDAAAALMEQDSDAYPNLEAALKGVRGISFAEDDTEDETDGTISAIDPNTGAISLPDGYELEH